MYMYGVHCILGVHCKLGVHTTYSTCTCTVRLETDEGWRQLDQCEGRWHLGAEGEGADCGEVAEFINNQGGEGAE